MLTVPFSAAGYFSSICMTHKTDSTHPRGDDAAKVKAVRRAERFP